MALYAVLGMPGSGKTSQAQHLAADYDMDYINTRNILSTHQRKQAGAASGLSSEAGRRIIRKMDRYNVTITDIEYHSMVMDEIDDDVVLDGYPSTPTQAALLDRDDNHDLDTAIYLHVEDEEELVSRLEERGDRIDVINGRLKFDRGRVPRLRHFYHKDDTTDLIYIDGNPEGGEKAVYNDVVDPLQLEEQVSARSD